MAHVIEVDLKAELFSYTVDEDKKRYLELRDTTLLLSTNTNATIIEVVQRYNSLADIERGFRLHNQILLTWGFCQIGPVYHRLVDRGLYIACAGAGEVRTPARQSGSWLPHADQRTCALSAPCIQPL